MHNAAKDNEMVAMKDSWIYNAIYDNRKGMVNSSAELETYKSEFDRYFLWVNTFE